MTDVEKAFAELNAAQDAASIVFRALEVARRDVKRSKSAKNVAAFIAANEAADAALEITDAAHEALELARVLADAAEAAVTKAAENYAQPAFAF